MIKAGIITGTGVHSIGLGGARKERIETPYGDAVVTVGTLAGLTVGWIQRHGSGHYLSPAAVNYQANLLALSYLGAERILATNAVGAISPSLSAGDICVLRDLIGLQRPAPSFYRCTVTHVDFTSPYSQRLGDAMRSAASALDLVLRDAVYAATAGPRFESAAEVEALRRAGATVVGMTSDFESCLARELGQEYASLAIVSNAAARSCGYVSTRAIMTAVARRVPAVSAILAATMPMICSQKAV